MTELAIVANNPLLSPEEKEEYKYHSLQIEKSIHRGQEAKRELISHVLHIIDNGLWREDYSSEEEYVKTELNMENLSSFRREAKNNRNYLHLLANAEDKDEEISLTRMRGLAYRQLRKLATDGKPVLKRGGESEEEYKKRLDEKETQDSEMVLELWKEVYPRIVRFKESSNTGHYPNGSATNH